MKRSEARKSKLYQSSAGKWNSILRKKRRRNNLRFSDAEVIATSQAMEEKLEYNAAVSASEYAAAKRKMMRPKI